MSNLRLPVNLFDVAGQIEPSEWDGEQLLVRSIQNGKIPPALLYRTPLQSERWEQVYHRWAPFLNSSDCRHIYLESSAFAADELAGGAWVVGMGCGDGQKDCDVLRAFASQQRPLGFVAMDVSASLVDLAATRAKSVPGVQRVETMVSNLCTRHDIRETLDELIGVADPRVFTFFGMIPNLIPTEAGRMLQSWLRPKDLLLFSANLVADSSSEAMKSILTQYDNAETRSWLSAFLEEGGVQAEDDCLNFSIEEDESVSTLQRIIAYYTMPEDCVFSAGEHEVPLRKDTVWRLFFSYRYTPRQVSELLERFNLRVTGSWITPNSQEGVFACRLES